MKKLLISALVCGVSFSCVESQAKVGPDEEEKENLRKFLPRESTEELLSQIVRSLNSSSLLKVLGGKPKKKKPLTPLQRFNELANARVLQGYERPYLGDVVSGSMRGALNTYHRGTTEEASQRFANSGLQYLGWARMVSEDTENIETGTELWDLYLSGAQAYRWAAHNASTVGLRNQYIVKARWALDKTLEVGRGDKVTSKVASERGKLDELEG